MRVLTNEDIRKIRDAVIGAGFMCEVHNGGDNSVRLDVDWVGYFGNAWRSGIEAICYFIRNTGVSVNIKFLHGDDDEVDKIGHYADGIECWASLLVTGV